MGSKWYVGFRREGNVVKREAFRYAGTPTKEKFGHKYDAIMGPFRTKGAAIIMERYGNSPHLQTVRDAERLNGLVRLGIVKLAG